MSIEAYLTSLIYPPRISFPNYSPVLKNILKNFSEFLNSFLSFDKTKISFSVYKNIEHSSNLRNLKTCLIYTHSHGSTRQEGLPILQVCSSLGLSLCLYDSRGCGDSGNACTTFGKNESLDLLYLILYCALIDGFTEFVLWGRSIGTCAVIQLLAKLSLQELEISGTKLDLDSQNWRASFEPINLREQLANFLDLNNFAYANEFRFLCAGVVLDSPLKSVSASIENFFSQNFLNIDLVSKFASGYAQKWIKNKTGIDIYALQNINLVRKINTNAIFVCSKKDEVVLFDDSLEVFNLYASKTTGVFKKVLEIPNKHKEARNVNAIIEALTFLLDNQKDNKTHFTFPMPTPKVTPFQQNFSEKKVDKGFRNMPLPSGPLSGIKKHYDQFWETSKQIPKSGINNLSYINTTNHILTPKNNEKEEFFSMVGYYNGSYIEHTPVSQKPRNQSNQIPGRVTEQILFPPKKDGISNNQTLMANVYSRVKQFSFIDPMNNISCPNKSTLTTSDAYQSDHNSSTLMNVYLKTQKDNQELSKILPPRKLTLNDSQDTPKKLPPRKLTLNEIHDHPRNLPPQKLFQIETHNPLKNLPPRKPAQSILEKNGAHVQPTHTNVHKIFNDVSFEQVPNSFDRNEYFNKSQFVGPSQANPSKAQFIDSLHSNHTYHRNSTLQPSDVYGVKSLLHQKPQIQGNNSVDKHSQMSVFKQVYDAQQKFQFKPKETFNQQMTNDNITLLNEWRNNKKTVDSSGLQSSQNSQTSGIYTSARTKQPSFNHFEVNLSRQVNSERKR